MDRDEAIKDIQLFRDNDWPGPEAELDKALQLGIEALNDVKILDRPLLPSETLTIERS